jgi:hypothetical protein
MQEELVLQKSLICDKDITGILIGPYLSSNFQSKRKRML